MASIALPVSLAGAFVLRCTAKTETVREEPISAYPRQKDPDANGEGGESDKK